MKNKKPWKPLRILFIGDEPSSRNVSPDVPFVGTASYKRLLRWIGELDLDIKNVRIENAGQIAYNDEDKIIFLGNKASNKTQIIGLGYFEAFLVHYLTIDHPSPRNRKFNEKGYEAKMLKQVRKWLYD